MGGGWTRDPVVASAGWWLVVVSLGWAAVAAIVLDLPASAVCLSFSAAFAGCAVGVLRGELWCVVVAALVVLLALPTLAYLTVLLSLPVMIMLAGAFARLRAGTAVSDHVRGPAAAAAGPACLVAAVAGVLWTAGWSGPGSGWEELLTKTVLLALPALVLAVAAVGMLLGTPGWAVVATGALVVTGLNVSTMVVWGGGLVPGRVPMDLALLGSAAIAYVRLLRVARGAGLDYE